MFKCRRRAPELASGELSRVLERWFAAEAAELLTICSFLPPAKRDVIVQDWEAAKQHLVYSFGAKFGFATIIPFALCGLAHHSEEVVAEFYGRAYNNMQVCLATHLVVRSGLVSLCFY